MALCPVITPQNLHWHKLRPVCRRPASSGRIPRWRPFSPCKLIVTLLPVSFFLPPPPPLSPPSVSLILFVSHLFSSFRCADTPINELQRDSFARLEVARSFICADHQFQQFVRRWTLILSLINSSIDSALRFLLSRCALINMTFTR